jgi:pimeloyl-ACP methyl ester carboxylesterase
MQVRGRARIPVRAVTLSAAAAGGAAAAGVAIQRRHARRISRDPEYLHLTRGLSGRPLGVSSADGTRLHAEVFGSDDGPTLVLAHGWTEQLSFWGGLIEILSARGVRLVAYDLRGHGRSAPASGGDYALERFGEDVEAVLVAGTREGERAVVAGHSLGAMAIAAWAEHHDVHAHARAAALVNTGLGDLISGHLLFGELARWLNHPAASRLFLGSRARIPSFSSPVQQALIRYSAFGPGATTAQVAFYERMLISCPADVRAACGVAMSDMNLWHAVACLTIPTLVVAGERDRLTPPAHARRIAETLPHLAALVELPDTGHMGPLERPRELADALTTLVRDASAAPSLGALG